MNGIDALRHGSAYPSAYPSGGATPSHVSSPRDSQSGLAVSGWFDPANVEATRALHAPARASGDSAEQLSQRFCACLFQG
jgi:hypothetical protein